jgi:hypothetical protein
MDKADRYSPPQQKFLVRLADAARPSIAAYNVAVILANPGDAVGCGAILRRIRGAQIITVCDGVAPSADSLKARSFAQPDAAARWRELLAALELAWQKPSTVTGLSVARSEAAAHSAATAGRLARIFAGCGTAIALTYVHEDFDPDRDATALAVRQAADQCRRRGQDVAVVEMAFSSSLAGGAEQTVRLALTAEERALKERMLGCFAPGANAPFRLPLPYEEFRPVPAPEFEQAPDWSKVLHAPHEGTMGVFP